MRILKDSQTHRYFSINLTESKHMMGTEDIEEIIKEYQSFQIPLVFLRRGQMGQS